MLIWVFGKSVLYFLQAVISAGTGVIYNCHFGALTHFRLLSL